MEESGFADDILHPAMYSTLYLDDISSYLRNTLIKNYILTWYENHSEK